MGKSLRIILASSLLFQLPFVCFAETPAEIQSQAIAEFKMGRFKHSAELYKVLVDQNPNDVDLLRDLMWAYWNAKMDSEIIATAQAILRLRQDDAEAHNLLAKTYAAHGDRSGAVKELENVANTKSSNFQVRLSLARLQVQNGNTAKAEAILRDLEKEVSPTSSLAPKIAEVWKLVARGYVGGSRQEKAITSYQHIMGSTKKDDVQVQIALARLYVDKKDFDQAEKLLVAALEKAPDTVSIYPKLARVRFLKGNFLQSADTWDEAIRAFPDRADYKFRMGEALYFAGRHDDAVNVYDSLLPDPEYGRRALDFLVDDALSQDDLPRAIKLYKDNLWDASVTDQDRLYRLATIYKKANDPANAVQALNRVLALAPLYGEALIAKSLFLVAKGEKSQAIRGLKHVLELNPYCTNALDALIFAYDSSGRERDALKALERFAQIDPTSPYLVLRRARLLYATGRHQDAREFLLDWLSKNPDRRTLPILLYHGLTPFRRDPMLAHSQHLTAKTFDNHIAELKKAGFTPVTVPEVAAWYQGKKDLPARPVLITFDDGRMDGMKYADPILERYNFKATMFVIGQNAERNLPNYANWTDLRNFKSNGRWDLQAHTDEGHGYVTTDEIGHRGLYLLYRKWLPMGRLETQEEWQDRITDDHQRCKAQLKAEVGVDAVGFAFPEGDFGQLEVSNAKDVVPVNMRLARQSYAVSFYQDSRGINLRSRDPSLLNRLEPPADWSGQDLVRHITDQNPFADAHALLLRWAVWEGKTQEAYEWLDALRKEGASDALLLSEEARIYAARNNLLMARQLEQQARDAGWKPEVDDPSGLTPAMAETRWGVGLAGSYFSDNVHRRSWTVEPSLIFGRVGNAKVQAIYRAGAYTEKDQKDVTESAGGALVSLVLGLRNTIDILGMGHSFTGGTAENTGSGSFTHRASWTDSFRTEVRISRDPLLLAGALAQNIRRTETDGSLGWKFSDHWDSILAGHYTDFTDDNERTAGQLEISRSWEGFFHPRVIAHGEATKNTETSPFYYSPTSYSEESLGVGTRMEILRGLTWDITYLPGIARETGISSKGVQNIGSSLEQKWSNESSAAVTYQYGETPTYRSHNVQLRIIYRFGSAIVRDAAPEGRITGPETPQPDMKDAQTF